MPKPLSDPAAGAAALARPAGLASPAGRALAVAVAVAVAGCPGDGDDGEEAEPADDGPTAEHPAPERDEDSPTGREPTSIEDLEAEAEEAWRDAVGRPRAYIPEASVYIPEESEATDALWIAAAHDGERIRVEFRYATEHPSWYHQYWIYDGEEWRAYGSPNPGPQQLGLHEDRLSWMLDDGSVDAFSQWGGYAATHRGLRSRTDAAAPDEVREHSRLGAGADAGEVLKFLTPSRQDGNERDLWRRVRGVDDLAALRERGVFLDVVEWRAHRSAPLGYAHNGYVLDSRAPAAGEPMVADNWDEDAGAPAWMYDPDEAGAPALRADRLLRREYGRDDRYYLAEDFAKPFDPDREWEEGDALPRALLREPSGSLAAAEAEAEWDDGRWSVAVERALEAENPRDSKSLEPGETYDVAFAVHAGATAGRWHYATMPLRLALEDGAEAGAGGAAEGEGEGGEGDDDAAGEESGDAADAGGGDGAGDTENAGGPGGDGDGREDATLVVPYAEDGLETLDREAFTRAPVFYPGQVFLGWLAENGHPVHERYQEARENPLDDGAVAAFAEALVAHELDFVSDLAREDADRASSGEGE